MGHAMMAKPIRALELHHPMIQFLINSNQYQSINNPACRKSF